MTNATENLIALCRRYLDNQVEVSEYIDMFEDMYLKVQDEITDSEYSILDDIYMANDYFEPHPLIREEDESFIDEDELRLKIQESIKKLTA